MKNKTIADIIATMLMGSAVILLAYLAGWWLDITYLNSSLDWFPPIRVLVGILPLACIAFCYTSGMMVRLWIFEDKI